MATKAQIAKSKRTPKYATRGNTRCEITGRSRGVYKKFRVSRIMLRKLAARGQSPGNAQGQLVSPNQTSHLSDGLGNVYPCR